MTSWGRRGFDDSESAAAEGGSSGGGGGDQLMSAGFGDTGLKSRFARSLRSWTGPGREQVGQRRRASDAGGDGRRRKSRSKPWAGGARGKKVEEAAGRFGIGKNQRQRSAAQRSADGWRDGWMDGSQVPADPAAVCQDVWDRWWPVPAGGSKGSGGWQVPACLKRACLSVLSRLDSTAACVPVVTRTFDV